MVWTLGLPIILAVSLVVTLEYGGTAALWKSGVLATVALAIFTFFQPEILLYYKGPLNAAGLYTVSFPITAAAVTIVLRLLYRPFFHLVIRLLVAIIIAWFGFNSCFWIA